MLSFSVAIIDGKKGVHSDATGVIGTSTPFFAIVFWCTAKLPLLYAPRRLSLPSVRMPVTPGGLMAAHSGWYAPMRATMTVMSSLI